MRGGRQLAAELADYPGFISRDQTWEVARAKFERLAAPYTTPRLREQLMSMVADELERVSVTDLTKLLGARLAGSEQRLRLRQRGLPKTHRTRTRWTRRPPPMRLIA